MRESKELSLALFPEINPNPTIRLSGDGKILYANPATTQFLSKLHLDPAHPENLFPSDLPRRLSTLKRSDAASDTWEYPILGRTVQCFIHFLAAYDVFHAYLTDITEQKRAQEIIYHQAYHDLLTGLPNRYVFEDHLEQALWWAPRIKRKSQQQVGVFLLGLDRFQAINTAMGHDIGDQLLKLVTERLLKAAAAFDNRPCAKVYRFESDTFALLVPDLSCLPEPVRLIEEITQQMNMPFHCNGQEIFATFSIGVSFYPLDGGDSKKLIKNAETAMLQAKAAGGNSFQYYSETFNVSAREWLFMESALHRALERQELQLYYQPQVEIKARRLMGSEALIRWMQPEKGVIAPETFIPLAEETSMIQAISEWALHTACRQGRQWQQEGLQPGTVSVNVSARQFAQADFSQQVSQILRDTGVLPEYLGLEITETLAMQDPDLTISVLNELKQQGVKLSIDDFGTGYSSLSYLYRFPIDVLKVDKSFVQNLLVDRNDALISQAIINLAHGMNMKVIAEGVETQEQLELLNSQSCDEIQGYLFSQPLTAEAMTQMLHVH